jgi:hypothetical protein
MNKKAIDLPLSPDEKYHASQLLGRSLFSAIQLAKEKELRHNLALKKLYNSEDDKVLKIPIPQSLMPSQKTAEHSRTYSVTESPEGELNYKEHDKDDLSTGRHLERNRGAYTGLAAGAGLAAATGGAALPFLAGGAALGSLGDSNPMHTGMRYSKTIEHIDGSKEHVFEMEKGKGLGAHLKRNAGKYLGTAGATAAIPFLPKSKSKLLLPLLGLLGGRAFDNINEAGDLEEMNKKPGLQEDLLTDAKFRQRMQLHQLQAKYPELADKQASDDSGIFGEAFHAIHSSPVRMLVGGQQGFRDAKKDYYMQQKDQIQKELMRAQKEYIDVLSRIKTGAAEEESMTPCVDAFCNGIAHMTLFGKTASFKEEEDIPIEYGSISRLLGSAGDALASPIKPLGTATAKGLMGTGAGAAYLTYLMRKKMREEPESYMEDHLPTRVELQPYV